jgi:hypothetical protein
MRIAFISIEVISAEKRAPLSEAAWKMKIYRVLSHFVIFALLTLDFSFN